MHESWRLRGARANQFPAGDPRPYDQRAITCGIHEEAISAHQDAAAIFQETGDGHGEGTALNNLEADRIEQAAQGSGIPQVKNRFCARVCARDAAGRGETGETWKARDGLALPVCRGRRGDRRLRETTETFVVVLITQRRPEGR
jgi:hypothetical protein